MNSLKQIGCILTLCMMLIITAAPAMASDGGGGARVIDVNGNDVTNENRVSNGSSSVSPSSISVTTDKGIAPEDIYSDTKVLGQDVKSGDIWDFINVKKWLNLMFVNNYVAAVASLVFAIVGLVIIFGSILSILCNAAKIAISMLHIDGDVEESVIKVHGHERSSITVIRGLGVCFLCLSALCAVISFIE